MAAINSALNTEVLIQYNRFFMGSSEVLVILDEE